MLSRKLKPRRSKTRMSAMRRQSKGFTKLFNAYHAYKIRLRYGRRKPIYIWSQNLGKLLIK
jgi:hypothetical protein